MGRVLTRADSSVTPLSLNSLPGSGRGCPTGSHPGTNRHAGGPAEGRPASVDVTEESENTVPICARPAHAGLWGRKPRAGWNPAPHNRSVDFQLNAVEVRALGSLLEKDITTPEYYPMTLNALVNACNQKSNRDPAVSYDDETVREALDSLRAKGLTGIITGPGNRVPKFTHRFSERLNLGRREHALLTELMLRGYQTVGELRNRGARMYEFSDLEEVEACLRSMMDRPDGALVTQMPHFAGTKEVRWAHLLSGEPALDAVEPPAADVHGAGVSMAERVAALEAEVSALKTQFQEFRKQFE